MDEKEIRLEIFKTLAPLSSRYDMENDELIEKCKVAEKFVKGPIRRGNKQNQS